MSMTDLLVIVVAVLFVLVLLDGLRRKWSDRNRVVLKLDKSMQGGDLSEEELTKSELPNGGARTKPRAGDEIPRPPKPVPKLKVLQQGLQELRQSGGDAVSGLAAGTTATTRAEVAQSHNVPVLLDTVDVEEERIEHTNVYADSSAVPVSVVETRAAVQHTQEETMGIYRDDIDASIQALDDTDEVFADALDLTADLAADRPLMNGRGDDEDEWEEEWDDEEEDEEEDEDEDDDLWEETWEDEEEDEDEDDDEYDDEDEGDFDDEEDEDEDEDDYEDDEDDYDEEDEEDDDEDDDDEPFPAYDDEEDETWNRQVAAPPQPLDSAPHRAAPGARQSSETAGSGGRVEPAFAPEELDVWDFEQEPDMGNQDYETYAPAEAPRTTAPAAPVARSTATERKPMFGTGFLSKRDQGELFRDEGQESPEAVDSDVDTPQEVIVINVMARYGRVFDGYELLPVLQLQGLRLGDMSIFHKHSGSNGSGSIVFSMANMVKPGTFDLATMDTFVTPGVSFFLQLPNKYGNMAAFEQMLTAANAIRHALDGELKDENRSVLTRQTLEHYRQRIRDFELSLLTRR